MPQWIYETPDNGRTVTRRILGRDEQHHGRQLRISDGAWFSIVSLEKIGLDMYEQQQLRLEYPALNQLWEEYQTMLRLLK